MTKRKDKKKVKRQAKSRAEAQAGIPVASDGSAPEAAVESKEKMSRKEFEK